MRFNGQFFRAPQKKFQELIFFIHFFGGSKKNLQKHIDLVNHLGFDAFAFDLQGRLSWTKWPWAKNRKFGWKHVYADQIEMLLHDIPGKKIVFSFSNPSASAIEAIKRLGFKDIQALICDSGPALHLPRSIYNLYCRDQVYPKPINWLVAPALAFFWDGQYRFDLSKDLRKFPSSLPVLSIRGWKDQVIPPKDIDQIFEGHLFNWQKMALPEAQHLNGLKDFEEEYTAGLKRFLDQVVTLI